MPQSLRKRIVVLSGAGISAESGLKTFRDSDGLWEGHSIEEVATPAGWKRNPELVLQFYNERRKAVRQAQPNAAHRALAQLESQFAVSIITQNIDDLHERAGSKSVLHLHGEILKSRSSVDDQLVYAMESDEIRLGELCERQSQLRPYVVWFGEAVPAMEPALELVRQAEIFIVVGTSLVVYPAASLIDYVPGRALKFLVDPKPAMLSYQMGYSVLAERASVALPLLVEKILSDNFLH